jgi:hypothetical protein
VLRLLRPDVFDDEQTGGDDQHSETSIHLDADVHSLALIPAAPFADASAA